MSEQRDFQLDERLRQANQLTPEATERILDLWPSIEAALVDDRPSVRRARPTRKRYIMIAIALFVLISVAAAVGSPTLRKIFWDEENKNVTGAVTEPGNSASLLLASKYATVSHDPRDRSEIEKIVANFDPAVVPVMKRSTRTHVTRADSIHRRLVFVESTNGGFCAIMQGGQVAPGGCSNKFPSNGLIESSGVIGTPGHMVHLIEGFVANDVTRIEMQLRSGLAEVVPIEHGLFAWSEVNRPRSRQAIGVVVTRDGKRIHMPLPIPPVNPASIVPHPK